MNSQIYDIAVIGAGIAGTSVAALLAEEYEVVLLEQEAVPAYHTTGRSAAVFAPCYGPAGIRALTRASESFFLRPPPGFSAGALVGERPIMLIARENQLSKLDKTEASLALSNHVERLAQNQLPRLNSLLRPEYALAGLLDRQGLDIDVAALHQGYLKSFKRAGGTIRTSGKVRALFREQGCWHLKVSNNTIRASIVVNAAGAWADEVATLAGVEPVGLSPKRRTAVIVAAPTGLDTQAIPITIDIDEQFYLKPEGRQLLISPADETPSAPCDAQPEEIDVAVCIDRISKAFDIDIERPLRQWAGLRSFVSDGEPVAGFDEHAEGFFWLAGQGGYGIQTAPALAELCTSMIGGKNLPANIGSQGLDLDALRPGRLQKPVS